MPAAGSIDTLWDQIAMLGDAARATPIADLFAADPRRIEDFSASLDDLTLDFSKTAISRAALVTLLDFARATGLETFRDRMFAGAEINPTEHRAALHVALRAPDGAAMTASLGGKTDDASAYVTLQRDRMRAFVAAVHEGRIVGATGLPFTDVLNIGIGGSDLGPRMVCEALTLVGPTHLTPHFLSNVDGHAFAALSRVLDPARTLVLVASKTFTTQETMTNARAARDWLAASLGDAAVGAHFAAMSTNAAATSAFGIAQDRVFGFRDWVGGRYSVWSPIGLSVALAAGWDAFQALLDGGHAMDQHFRNAPLARNLPVLLALVGIWNVNAMGSRTHCVLAYDRRLQRFPAFLQQLEMESNGKSVLLDASPSPRPTGPVLFGEPGTDAQHSFMQLVHQGTQPVPVDFLLAAIPDHNRPEAHQILAAHAFAQAEALLAGKSLGTVQQEMRAAGASDAEITAGAPHRVFSGNRPSNMILFRRLDAFTLGRLIALYEHKVAVQGCIWNIDSFDQWGVELGKVLAGRLLPDLTHGTAAAPHDPSTSALITRFRSLRGEE